MFSLVGRNLTGSCLFEALYVLIQSGCWQGHDHYHDAVMVKTEAGTAAAVAPYLLYGRVTAFSPPVDFEGAGGKLPFRRGGRVLEVTAPSSSSNMAGGDGSSTGTAGGHVRTWVATVDGEDEGSRFAMVLGSEVTHAARL